MSEALLNATTDAAQTEVDAAGAAASAEAARAAADAALATAHAASAIAETEAAQLVARNEARVAEVEIGVRECLSISRELQSQMQMMMGRLEEISTQIPASLSSTPPPEGPEVVIVADDPAVVIRPEADVIAEPESNHGGADAPEPAQPERPRKRIRLL